MPVRLVPQQGKYVWVKASLAVLHYNPIGGTKDYLHVSRQYFSERTVASSGYIYYKQGAQHLKTHQDIQQHQALAPCCPLPEVYSVLEFADGCKGNLHRQHTVLNKCDAHALGGLGFIRPKNAAKRAITTYMSPL